MSLADLCTPQTFGSLALAGAEILSIDATVVLNHTPTPGPGQPPVETHLDFCNATVSYTHPGQGDSIVVEAWLPAAESWNKRLQAVGGAGYVAGRLPYSYAAMDAAVAGGYVTVTTDAGLGDASDAGPWGLVSEGNVNLYNLQNLASVSLNDQAIIAKSLIRSFYDKAPEYSYWNGCSQGGRQGLMLAQRYPDAYDGIMAGAPTLYWTELVSSIQWPQQVMNVLGWFPRGCEIDALIAAAVAECDLLDGVEDGIIGEIDACLERVDPFRLVGSSIPCEQAGGNDVEISEAAAIVVNATWNGWRSQDGMYSWYGIPPGADVSGNGPTTYGVPGVAATSCEEGTCVAAPNVLGTQWLQLFVEKDSTLDMLSLTHEKFDTLVHASGQMYRSTISTVDPDLSRFRDAGGKMVTFHGLADSLIPPQGTERYYNEVWDLLPDVHDFYRYFEAPGLGHCFGGRSAPPAGLFDQLRAWVENGTAPEQTPARITDLEGDQQDRILCPYPKKGKFNKKCGRAGDAKCWGCVTVGRGGPESPHRHGRMCGP
ncbi:related to feruloyl esterase B precursor [Cephalotrichum gorgonifer]|uniref:Carboxylic ester hydrolase n=1 Tax=Cephalotrichum gorgonifer TaxID=2041049 RepID=A0AAE8SVI0_9PEZI|nr:related to feruloyl esterase B precursor [Cephalotrichum gorgonifer]